MGNYSGMHRAQVIKCKLMGSCFNCMVIVTEVTMVLKAGKYFEGYENNEFNLCFLKLLEQSMYIFLFVISKILEECKTCMCTI